MHYAMSDQLLHERDVLAMAKVMPNTETRRVARNNFTHNDFIADPEVKELVTDYIINELKKLQ